MEVSIPRPDPVSDGDYGTLVTQGYGQPVAVIHLAEGHALDLRSLTADDCDRLIRAAARVKGQILDLQARAAAPHGRGNVYMGTCQLCGKPEADELHAEPVSTEAAEAAVLAESIRTGAPLLVDDDDPRCECSHQQTLHDEDGAHECRAVACGCNRFRSAAPKAQPEPYTGHLRTPAIPAGPDDPNRLRMAEQGVMPS